jgi:hypothetical protein
LFVPFLLVAQTIEAKIHYLEEPAFLTVRSIERPLPDLFWHLLVYHGHGKSGIAGVSVSGQDSRFAKVAEESEQQ